MAEDLNTFIASIVLRRGALDEPEANEGNQDQMQQVDENGNPVETQQESQPPKTLPGEVMLLDLLIAPTIREICEEAKKIVPEPRWPNPDKEPLPPPVIH